MSDKVLCCKLPAKNAVHEPSAPVILHIPLQTVLFRDVQEIKRSNSLDLCL
jgi:hypothetical protein